MEMMSHSTIQNIKRKLAAIMALLMFLAAIPLNGLSVRAYSGDATSDGENGITTVTGGNSGSFTVTGGDGGSSTVTGGDGKLPTDTVKINPESIVLKYGESCKLEVTSKSNSSIDFSSSDPNAVEVSADGEITAKASSGEVIITATSAGSEQYNPGKATCVVKLQKASQEIEFVDAEGKPVTSINVYTGQAIEALTAREKADTAYGTEMITYEIMEDDKSILTGINRETGEITVSSEYPAGSVIIQATKAEDLNYLEATATYTINVEEWQPEGTYYSLKGDKKLPDSDWFTDNVFVEAAGGYEISYEKNSNAEWERELADAAVSDGEKAQYSFYIKRMSDGAISGLTTVSFKKDTVAPSVSIKASGISGWDKFLSIITFGLWGKDEIDFTIESDDGENGSGVASVQYYIDTETAMKPDLGTQDAVDMLNALDESKWNAYADGFSLQKDSVAVVYAKVTDRAGNYTYASTNGVVFDSQAPTTTLVPLSMPNEAGFYSSDVEIQVKASDIAPYSGIKSIEYWIESNGIATKGSKDKPVSLYSFEKEDPEYADLTASYDSSVSNNNIIISAAENNSDDVVLYVRVTDNAGNVKNIGTDEKVYSARQELKISSSKPTIQVTYEEDPAAIETHNGVAYYNSGRRAKIVITGRTSVFAEDLPVINVSTARYNAAAGTYETVSIDGLYEMSGWSTVEGTVSGGNDATHTLYIDFYGDANYSFTVDYTDKAGNTAVYTPQNGMTTEGFKSGSFTVDKTSPTAEIQVNENIWDRLLHVITFGRWGKADSANVKASSQDDTSPTKIEYFVTEDAEPKNAAMLDAVSAWTAYEREFSIKPDKQFVVYLKVSDYAGNYIYINSDGHIIEKTAASISITPDNPVAVVNGIGVYNSDVNAVISVTEGESNYSGIRTVEYWVTADGKETQREILYSCQYTTEPLQKDLTQNFSKEVTVSASKNNSSNVVLNVRVTDNAGNVSQKSQVLDIDVTAPAISVAYADEKPVKKVVAGSGSVEHGYFDGNRTATIQIMERANHFDPQAATDGITITATNAKGETVIADTKTLISGWTVVPGEDADTTVHMATISYNMDANYTFAISYVDKAQNGNGPVSTGDSVTPGSFTVDKTAPTGMISVEQLGTWDKLLSAITFGRWSKESLQVSAVYDDATSFVETVSYYKTSSTRVLSASELDAVTEWIPYQNFSINANEKFTVYLKVVDAAGNVTYISTDGIIIDDVMPAIENVGPQITVSAEGDVYGVVSTDVPISVSVTDPVSGDTKAYSGLREITYEVYSQGALTQSETLFSFNNENPTHEELVQNWSSQSAFVVDRTLNNSNDVEVRVHAVDNAGNASTQTIRLQIDITAPRIEVQYDNNDGDATFTGDGTEAYFKEVRTATITIYERNFNPEDVELVITNTDGETPSIGGWSKTEGSGNGDDSANVATLTYSADGDYTFEVTCKDAAGNTAEAPDYGSSLAPTKFTIDRTLPQFAVSYDNNDYRNENYYKEGRTATLTITEHNFETSRVNVILNATDDGQSAEIPGISNWSSNGDVHTATIYYPGDALYSFDIEYSDKAGNTMEDFTEQSFYVDTTPPVVTISNITDESANNDDGNIGFTMTVTDTNFDAFVPEIIAVVREGNEFKQRSYEGGSFSSVSNGRSYTVSNLEEDGIYRIFCTAVDKAGNEFTEVNLYRPNGTPYTEARNGSDVLLKFSVNRDGSTFELDRSTLEVVDNYYVQNVTQNIAIVEINADEITEHTVSVDGNELTEGTDYTVNSEGGDGNWRKYTYSIDQSLFEKEGEYNIVVASTDEAKNNAFSDVKSASIKFVVDRTAPVVSASGLATDGRYQTDVQTVSLIPSDDGGRLKSITVSRVDEDGKSLGELLHLEEDELDEELSINGGVLTFNLSEGLYQNVRIVCKDYSAGENGDTNTYDETFTNVSVSTSAIMIFWANKVVRNIVIAGGTTAVCGAAATPGLFKWYKRRKTKL